MKLYEIIEKVIAGGWLNYNDVHPYRESIKKYCTDYFCAGPIIFLVGSATNTGVSGYIVPEGDLMEKVNEITTCEDEQEIVLFNSFLL
ncbi:MAG TPA: hypothetical protein VK031_06585 [Tissierellaceae bacterium]|nr:hypothetical protein [Tissierellaceae bacterium]